MAILAVQVRLPESLQKASPAQIARGVEQSPPIGMGRAGSSKEATKQDPAQHTAGSTQAVLSHWAEMQSSSAKQAPPDATVPRNVSPQARGSDIPNRSTWLQVANVDEPTAAKQAAAALPSYLILPAMISTVSWSKLGLNDAVQVALSGYWPQRTSTVQTVSVVLAARSEIGMPSPHADMDMATTVATKAGKASLHRRPMVTDWPTAGTMGRL